MSMSVMDSATETPYSAERSSWARGGMSSGGLQRENGQRWQLA